MCVASLLSTEENPLQIKTHLVSENTTRACSCTVALSVPCSITWQKICRNCFMRNDLYAVKLEENSDETRCWQTENCWKTILLIQRLFFIFRFKYFKNNPYEHQVSGWSLRILCNFLSGAPGWFQLVVIWGDIAFQRGSNRRCIFNPWYCLFVHAGYHGNHRG